MRLASALSLRAGVGVDGGESGPSRGKEVHAKPHETRRQPSPDMGIRYARYHEREHDGWLDECFRGVDLPFRCGRGRRRARGRRSRAGRGAPRAEDLPAHDERRRRRPDELQPGHRRRRQGADRPRDRRPRRRDGQVHRRQRHPVPHAQPHQGPGDALAARPVRTRSSTSSR